MNNNSSNSYLVSYQLSVIIVIDIWLVMTRKGGRKLVIINFNNKEKVDENLRQSRTQIRVHPSDARSDCTFQET
jgi:hypothetical protein